jgi:hypothetical protein
LNGVLCRSGLGVFSLVLFLNFMFKFTSLPHEALWICSLGVFSTFSLCLSFCTVKSFVNYFFMLLLLCHQLICLSLQWGFLILL